MTKKMLSELAIACMSLMFAFACSGGVQTSCGTVTDADGGIEYLPCGGSSGIGGDANDAGGPGLNFAGAPTTGGVSSVGGSSSVGGAISTGCTSTEPTGFVPSIEYCGPTQNLGRISCASWMGGNSSDPNDPLGKIPDWGIYQFNNPTFSDRSDIQLKIGVSPFRVDMGVTYSFFNTLYLYIKGLPESQPFVAFSLADLMQENEGDTFGVIWVHLYDLTSPSIVVLADSTLEFRLSASLCPIFPIGSAQRAIPALGEEMEIFILGYLYVDELVGSTYVELPEKRIFGSVIP